MAKFYFPHSHEFQRVIDLLIEVRIAAGKPVTMAWIERIIERLELEIRDICEK